MFDSSYGQFPTRWEALDDALFAPGEGVVERYQDEVFFGLMTYTADHTSNMCPRTRIEAPALGNLEAIRDLYGRESQRPSFKAETPTGAALRAAAERLAALEDDDPKHILLVTDGNPDDCTTPDPQCGQDESIATVQQARAWGIGTSVVGISDDVSAQHLQDLANAGQGLPVRAPDMQYVYNCVNPGFAAQNASYAAEEEAQGDAPVYQPADTEALASALDALIRGAYGCTFELRAEVEPAEAHRGRVELDDTLLEHGSPDGWSLRDRRTLQLEGAACEQVKTDSDELHIRFPCEAVELI